MHALQQNLHTYQQTRQPTATTNKQTNRSMAYRIHVPEKNTFLQDCDDDGEDAAGGRLLHLLQVRLGVGVPVWPQVLAAVGMSVHRCAQGMRNHLGIHIVATRACGEGKSRR